MKHWVAVATLEAVRQGLREKDYPQFETIVRASMALTGFKREEMDADLGPTGDKVMRTLLALLRADPAEFARQHKAARQNFNARN